MLLTLLLSNMYIQGVVFDLCSRFNLPGLYDCLVKIIAIFRLSLWFHFYSQQFIFLLLSGLPLSLQSGFRVYGESQFVHLNSLSFKQH